MKNDDPITVEIDVNELPINKISTDQLLNEGTFGLESAGKFKVSANYASVNVSIQRPEDKSATTYSFSIDALVIAALIAHREVHPEPTEDFNTRMAEVLRPQRGIHRMVR